MLTPEDRVLLSPAGRQLERILLYRWVKDRRDMGSQTDTKFGTTLRQILDSYDNVDSFAAERREHEALRARVARLTEQLQQDNGAQRVSNAPALPRKGGAVTN